MHTNNAAAQQKLAAYKSLIDADIARYCHDLLASTDANFSPYSTEAMRSFTDLLSRGGKRLRGALVIESYRMCGGTDDALAIAAARAAEMIHMYLLMVDDVCDRSALRRGAATAHVLMAQHHKEQALQGDAEHFGVSMALLSSL